MFSPLARRLVFPALLGLLGAAAGPVVAQAGPAKAGVHASAPSSSVLSQDEFSLIGCGSATDCLAAGTNTNVASSLDAASWNGSAWQVQDPVEPAGAQAATSEFLGESCPAVQRCVVVGEYQNQTSNMLTLAELWTGTAWQQLDTRYPSSDDHLGGVSCPAAQECVAVGGDRGFGGSRLPLAELWRGGAWTTMTTPTLTNPDYGTMFNAVSCASASWCMAVGDYNDTQSTVTLAETWNGSQWTQVAAPGGGLTAVSCTSPSACLATSGSTVQQWNGTAWSVITPPPGSPSLASVSCRSATDCLLTGNAGGGPYAAVWNGSGFRQQPVPNPAGRAELLDAVCPAAASCEGVGSSGGGPGSTGSFSLAAGWNGTAWTVSRMGPYDSLAAVSCGSATRCLATGSYLTPGDDQVALAEQEQSGGTWQPVSPAPPSPGVSELYQVSCLSAANCMATSGSLGDHWNGTSWHQTQIPGGSGGLSCAGTGCVTVGGLSAAAWNGTSWRKLPAAIKPKGSTGPYLGPVSCVSATWCMAVGQYYTDPHESYGIDQAEVWNGTAWTLLDPPSGGANSTLTSVSCTSETNCVALGIANNNTDVYQSFAAAWNGSGWKLTQISGQNRILLSVDCTAASQCQAVGYLTTVAAYPASQPIGESWNGSTWSAAAISLPNGSLNSLSCTGARACVAVGSTNAGQTRAASWNGSRWAAQPTTNP